jgi:predicted NBD/HSP70 family sugar kinase
VVCVAVGAGIGAGFLSGGALLCGPSGAAGEIGHTTVDPTGPRCSCGNYGCLETVASGPAIVRNTLKLIKQGHPSLLTDMVADLDSLDARDVSAAAARGDAVSIRVLEDAGRYLGLSVANLCNTLDMRHILIGGGVSRSGPAFMQTLEATVQARVLDMGTTSPVILTLQLGDDASPLGGATLAFDRFFQTGLVAQ